MEKFVAAMAGVKPRATRTPETKKRIKAASLYKDEEKYSSLGHRFSKIRK
jgi:hypothetical protein